MVDRALDSGSEFLDDLVEVRGSGWAHKAETASNVFVVLGLVERLLLVSVICARCCVSCDKHFAMYVKGF